MEKKIIDIHAHAYRIPVPFVVQFCTPEELIACYDRVGIARGGLLPIVSPEIYSPQANEDILEMVERHPDRFFPFCNIDPRMLTNSADAPLDTVIRHYKDKGCRGIGEIMPNLPMRHPLVQNLFKCAEKAGGMPVTWDNSDWESEDFGLYDDPGLPQLEHTLQRYEKLDFIGHGPCFWAEIGRLERPAQRKTVFKAGGEQVGYNPPEGKIREEGVLPQLLRKYPNLYGELSDAYYALRRDEEHGPAFLEEFQDRLFYGSDACSVEAAFSTLFLLKDWHGRKLISETVFDKITGLNAIHFFGL